MAWLAWRQFRVQAAAAVAAVTVVVVALVVTRGHLVDTYGPSGNTDLTGFYVWLRLLGTALIGVPAIIGAFWGAPLLAREFEEHTHRMIWTQSITRRRWLATKLAVIGTVTVAVVTVFALVFTWWSTPIDAAGNRIGSANFAQRGVVPIGYALFGLALGTLAGTMLRRTLPAMGATLVGFFVVRLFFQKVIRDRLLSAKTVNLGLFGADNTAGRVLSSHTVDAAGRTISTSNLESTLVAACNITRETPDADKALADCAQKFGYHDVAQVHTAGQFWSLQALELGCFLALTAVIIATCFWWLDHRGS